MATITVKSNSKSTSLLAGTESSYSEHFLDNGSIQGTYYCERYGRMVDLSVSLVDKLRKTQPLNYSRFQKNIGQVERLILLVSLTLEVRFLANLLSRLPQMELYRLTLASMNSWITLSISLI